jgi:hypothetical protein
VVELVRVAARFQEGAVLALGFVTLESVAGNQGAPARISERGDLIAFDATPAKPPFLHDGQEV